RVLGSCRRPPPTARSSRKYDQIVSCTSAGFQPSRPAPTPADGAAATSRPTPRGRHASSAGRSAPWPRASPAPRSGRARRPAAPRRAAPSPTSASPPSRPPWPCRRRGRTARRSASAARPPSAPRRHPAPPARGEVAVTSQVEGPDDDLALVAACGGERAVATEGDRAQPAYLPVEGVRQLPRRSVVELHRVVVARRGEEPHRRVEREAGEQLAVVV